MIVFIGFIVSVIASEASEKNWQKYK